MNLLDRLRQHAVVGPTQTAVEWADGSLSYASLVVQIEDAMQLLHDTGAHTVAVDLDNHPAWIVLDIAAMQLDICLVPLPPFFSATQIAHVIARAGVQRIITDSEARLRGRVGEHLQTTTSSLKLCDRAISMVAVRESSGDDAAQVPQHVHKITFTSGTTGQPKGVMLSWAHIHPVVTSLVKATSMRADDRHLCLLPLAVLLENVAGVYVPLWAGGTVVVLPMDRVGMTGSSGLDTVRMTRALVATAATTAIFTPQTLQGVVEACEADYRLLTRLRFAAVGGAPVSARLLGRAVECGIPVYEGYGLSECCSVVCLNTSAAHKPGSVGRPLAHVRVRIADDGEVVVCGQAFAGYLGETAIDTDGWRTGDLGEIDENGFLYLHGRQRNVFITAFGRNVAPEWVERELLLEPAIAQVAVFGEARPFNIAVIVSGRGVRPADIEAAIARTNQGLPDYARIARWIEADMPFTPDNGLLTGTGRVRRDALLERYADIVESIYCEAQTS